jgi:hypothetical protein
MLAINLFKRMRIELDRSAHAHYSLYSLRQRNERTYVFKNNSMLKILERGVRGSDNSKKLCRRYVVCRMSYDINCRGAILTWLFGNDSWMCNWGFCGSSFQDYDGQARAEKLSRIIILLFGVSKDNFFIIN